MALAPASAHAETVCGTVAEFNAAMAAAGTASVDVTLTFDVVGVAPADFHNDKGSLAQMRNTACDGLQDAAIKVYGTSEPLNTMHPPGTLKLEYANTCCPGACTEQWAEPNPSAAIFVDGSEQCGVTMFVRPTEVGYRLACDVGTFDAVGGNPEGNVVDQIAVLAYLLADGGTTWELTNATASNEQVCWEVPVPPPGGGDGGTMTVPVLEDVTAAPAYPDTVFPDVADLAVEAGDAAAYLKFDVPPIDGTITAVRLTMHTAGPSADGDGGEVHVVADSAWSESTMTWNTRPSHDATSLGRIGPAAADVSVSVELSGGPDVIDPAGGLHSFAVVSPPTDGNGTHFASKEGSAANAASLTIEWVASAGDGGGDDSGGGGGGGDDSGDAASGSDGDTTVGDADGTAPLPGLGDRGDDERGCACTSARRSAPPQLVLALLGLVLGYRRRCRPVHRLVHRA